MTTQPDEQMEMTPEMEAWVRLWGKTVVNAFFYEPPGVRRTARGVVIRTHASTHIKAVSAIIAGAALIVLMWIMPEDTGSIGVWILAATGGLMALGGLYELFDVRQMIFEADGDALLVRYGLRSRVRTLCIPRDGLGAELRVEPKKGTTVLVLTHTLAPDMPAVLVRCRRPDELRAAANALAECLGRAIIDARDVDVTMPDGRNVRVPLLPLPRLALLLPLGVRVKIRLGETARILTRMRAKLYAAVVALLLLEVYALVMAWHFEPEPWVWRTAMIAAASLAAALLGLLGYHTFRFRTTLTLDPRNDTLAVRGRAGRATVARADIVAVQVCCVAAEAKSVGVYWEVLLVVADPDVRRILLMAFSRPERAREEALLLASFLGVTPLDDPPKEC